MLASHLLHLCWMLLSLRWVPSYRSWYGSALEVNHTSERYNDQYSPLSRGSSSLSIPPSTTLVPWFAFYHHFFPNFCKWPVFFSTAIIATRRGLQTTMGLYHVKRSSPGLHCFKHHWKLFVIGNEENHSCYIQTFPTALFSARTWTDTRETTHCFQSCRTSSLFGECCCLTWKHNFSSTQILETTIRSSIPSAHGMKSTQHHDSHFAGDLNPRVLTFQVTTRTFPLSPARLLNLYHHWK